MFEVHINSLTCSHMFSNMFMLMLEVYVCSLCLKFMIEMRV